MGIESSESRPDIYEPQFETPEILEVGGGRITIVDLQPTHPKTKIPLVLVPGWAATAEVHKKNAKIFAESGRRVVVLSAPHGVQQEAGEDSEVPIAELRKAESVMQVLDAKDIDKADIVTHSEGALFVTAAALQNPERFRNIIYYAPAGLIGEDSFWQLATRFNVDMLKQLSEWRKEKGRVGQMGIALFEGVKAIVHSPGKSLAEIKAIAASQIQNNLRDLRNKGIGIVIVHPIGDRAFPMERMQQMVDGKMVDGFLSVGDPTQTGVTSDTHNSWYLSPEKFTPAIDSLLDTLERNANRKKTESTTT